MRTAELIWARRSLILFTCVCVGALVTATSAWAGGGGSSGSLRLNIRAGVGLTYAQSAVRAALARTQPHATPSRTSRPGWAGSVVLRISPGPLSQLGRWSMLHPLWTSAATEYGVPWQVLAAIDMIESADGANLGPSSAGAIGWMQFMPGTWKAYGVDASGDGVADPNVASDAIRSAARYLAASGAATNLPRALYAYNHAWWYVADVLSLARSYGYVPPPGRQSGSSTPAAAFAARAKMNSRSLSRLR